MCENLPSGWKKTPLENIANIRFSGVDKKSKPGERKVKLCNYIDVYNNEYITGEIPFMEATASVSEIESFSISDGDLMITKDSETPFDIGVPSVVSEPLENVICGYHLAHIKPKLEEIEPIFLAKQLCTDRIVRYFSQQANGVTRYGLSTSAIENTPIWLPSTLNEQEVISNILYTTDSLIQQTEAKIDKLGKIKAGLMQDLLTKGIDEDGEIRDPQKHPELFQDSPLGIIPKEWDVIQICENFTVQGGFAFSSNDFVEYGCPLLRISNIKDGRVDLVERASLPSNFRVTHRTFLAEENDIVMALSGATTGKSAIVKKQDLPLLVNQRVGRFINNDKEIYSSLFLFEIIQRQEFLKILLVDAIGGAQPNISPERIEKSLIPKPSYEEQLRITSVVLNVNKKINKEICYTIKLKLIKKGLMQDLLTGRKRVPKEMIKEGAIYA